jgi:hypothetical protein
LRACPHLAKTYFSRPLQQTIDDFTSQNLDMQYTIYLCGNQFMHPPKLHLAMPFASEGEKAAVFLTQKLEQADDLTTRDIILVFAEMTRQNSYDVQGDARLMETLKKRVQSIKDDYWREHANNLLLEIERK